MTYSGAAGVQLIKGAGGLRIAVLGGWLMVRVSRRAALLSSGLLQAAAFGLYILVAVGVGGTHLLWAATIAEGIVSTMASIALFALMMDASDPHHAGTDYTLLASIVNLVGSLGGIAGGVVGLRVGQAGLPIEWMQQLRGLEICEPIFKKLVAHQTKPTR